MGNLTGYWHFNQKKNSFENSETEPLSIFPTIVDGKNRTVYCRKCHRWEYIIAFRQNVLKTQCGALYLGPFVRDNSIISYGYDIQKVEQGYAISVKSQLAAISNHRNFEINYLLDLDKRMLFRDGVSVYENEEIRKILCPEVTEQMIDVMGEEFKTRYGIKPSVVSNLQGFNLIVGYMLTPFNINFYKISQHWGLNPYDKDFTSLCSGDTPVAEDEMFKSLNIKPTKTIRKMYQKYPQSVICYAAFKDLGFTDVNLLQKSVTPQTYEFFKYYMISFAGGFITYNYRTELKAFVSDLLAISNQKTVWNSIERTIGYFSEANFPAYIINDGMEMYYNFRQDLNNQEKKDIMKEGFNEYTHDFLLRRTQENENNLEDLEDQLNELLDGIFGNNYKQPKDYTFDIEDEFLALEYKAGDSRKNVYNAKTQRYEIVDVPDEDRYCFYVAKDTQTLKEIGSAMHNCVGWGYGNSVKNRHSTIVYAKYKNKYQICIEVTPEFTIRQSLGPCNKPLAGEALDAYREWCKEKHIKFVKAFKIHLGP